MPRRRNANGGAPQAPRPHRGERCCARRGSRAGSVSPHGFVESRRTRRICTGAAFGPPEAEAVCPPHIRCVLCILRARRRQCFAPTLRVTAYLSAAGSGPSPARLPRDARTRHAHQAKRSRRVVLPPCWSTSCTPSAWLGAGDDQAGLHGRREPVASFATPHAARTMCYLSHVTGGTVEFCGTFRTLLRSR